MNEYMPSYGVTELAPDEAAAISGGVFWGLLWVGAAIAAYVAATFGW
ncbi:hypothetical protein ACWTU6_30020 [Mesorhizobium sp. BHbsci]